MNLQHLKNSNLLSPREDLVVSRLKKEFAKRVQKNPRLSLRAFALSLGIDQSHLSKILAKRVKLSEKMIFHLSSGLGIKPLELDNTSGGSFEFIEDEKFEFISDWIHFAILELMKTKGFRYDLKWMAKRIGVNENAIKVAVERLIKLGVLKQVKKGHLTFTHKSLEWNNTAKTSYARKMLQKELLKKSIECIDAVDIQLRENSSLTVALPVDLIPELKREIIKFKNKINDICESHNSCDEVYQLCISLFPITDLKGLS